MKLFLSSADVEKKYQIKLDAPKKMSLKAFLKSRGYKSLAEMIKIKPIKNDRVKK